VLPERIDSGIDSRIDRITEIFKNKDFFPRKSENENQ
jgi:hypothetical protein